MCESVSRRLPQQGAPASSRNSSSQVWIRPYCSKKSPFLHHLVPEKGLHPGRPTGVRVKDPLALVPWISQDRGGAKLIFQCVKGVLAVFIPFKIDSSHSQSVQRSCYSSKIRHKTAIVRTEPQETSDFRHRGRNRPIPDSLRLARVAGHALTGNDVPQEFHILTEDKTLRGGKLQVGLDES